MRDRLADALWRVDGAIEANVRAGEALAGAIVRYASVDELADAVADGTLPNSVDKVILLQEYVHARGGSITRIETLGGRFLYALDVGSNGESFDLCAADGFIALPGKSAITMKPVVPSREMIEAAEAIAQAAGLDVGGVELLIDDRDGASRFYDINALSNFVADPLNVLGWDPHDRLIDFIEAAIEKRDSKEFRIFGAGVPRVASRR